MQPVFPKILNSTFWIALQIPFPSLAPLQIMQYFSQKTGGLFCFISVGFVSSTATLEFLKYLLMAGISCSATCLYVFGS
jgi:hypothetical protein